MGMFVRCVLVVIVSVKAAAAGDLQEQNQFGYDIDPVDHQQDLLSKEQEKRTVFSSNRAWAKHVGIHPAGFKYVIGYGPVDYKYVPVLRPLSIRPHYHYRPKIHLKHPLVVKPFLPVRPVIHQDGWKPIVPVVKPVPIHVPEPPQIPHKPWHQPGWISAKPVHVSVPVVKPIVQVGHVHHDVKPVVPIVKPIVQVEHVHHDVKPVVPIVKPIVQVEHVHQIVKPILQVPLKPVVPAQIPVKPVVSIIPPKPLIPIAPPIKPIVPIPTAPEILIPQHHHHHHVVPETLVPAPQPLVPLHPHLFPQPLLPHHHHLLPSTPIEPHFHHLVPSEPLHPHHVVPQTPLPEQHDVQTPLVPQNPAVFQQELPEDVFHQHVPQTGPTLFHQQLPGNVQHLFNQQIHHGEDATSTIFLQGSSIQPGQTDLQIPLHLPQHPNYLPDGGRHFQPGNFHDPSQHPDVVRPSLGLQPPFTRK